jgi:tetratricopeptide (TPR) repeat protein
MLRIALVVALAVAQSGLARAADPPPLTATQREGERRAQAAFAAGRYEESVEIYANLWAEHHDPIYLRNIGRCYQRLRNPDRAIASFEEYLAKARRLGAAEHREIEGYIRDLRALKEQQEAEARRNATPEPPPPVERPVERVPAPAAVPPPAPVVAPRPEVTTAAVPAVDEGSRRWRRVGWGALIAAGALAAGGGAFLWSSWSRYSDANAHCAAQPPTACADAADQVKTRNWTSRILFAGAAVAAVAGGTVIFLHPTGESGPATARGWTVGAARTF